MKDAYSCDRDEAGLDASYDAQYGAYVRTFERFGLDTVSVSSDVGVMGGIAGPRVHGPQPGGRGRPRAVRGVRLRRQPPGRVVPKPEPPAEEPLPLEEVETPGTTTIATLAAFLGVEPERTAKAAFFVTGDGRLVTAIVRGDHEVNETKLVNAVSATGGIRPAPVEEIKAAGHGARATARRSVPTTRVVVIDDSWPRSPNLVAGANREGFHLSQRQRRSRLHARRGRRHHQCPGGRALPRLRPARHPAQRDRGREHLQARDKIHQGSRRRRTSARTAEATRS